MSDKDFEIGDDVLADMGYSEDEIKKIKRYMKNGKMTFAQAVAKMHEGKAIIKSKEPVETVMADTMKDLKDIAIQRIDSGNGQPIFLVNAGGKQKEGDMNTVITFLKDMMKEYGNKGDNKEVQEIKEKLANLEDLLKKEKEKEKEDKVEEIESVLGAKITKLEDMLGTLGMGGTESVDIIEVLKALSKDGSLNQILDIAKQMLRNRAKQIDVQRNMSLFDKALILSNKVDDVDKIMKLIKAMKEMSKAEEEIEIVPEKEE